MKRISILIIGIMMAVSAMAQSQQPERKGFTIGGSAGVGVIHFTSGMSDQETQGNIVLPNMKIGWFANPRLAFYLNTPGQVYEKDGLDRSFEGIIPTIQYWTSDRWWIGGGFGPALDTRAIYESRSKSAKTHWGKGVLLSSGYEITQRKKWAMDLQARLYMASIDQGELDPLEGTSFTLGVGFTLY